MYKALMCRVVMRRILSEIQVLMEKLAKPSWWDEPLTLERILNKKWVSLSGIHSALMEIGAKELPNKGDWAALYSLPHGYFGVKRESDGFTLEEC